MSGYDLNPREHGAREALERYASESEWVASGSRVDLDVSYGPHERQRLDVFTGGPEVAQRAAVVFFHGGYWRAGDKATRRFPADHWASESVAWIPVNYRLTPEFPLSACVEDARSAVSFIFEAAGRWGIDPSRVHLAGNSAGAHLAAMVAGELVKESSEDNPSVASLTAVSGLYDLTGLIDHTPNAWLKLDRETARRLSPINTPLPAGLPVHVCWGDDETDVFRDQSSSYADACRAWGCMVTTTACKGHGHFSIIGDFARPDSSIFRWIRSLIADEGQQALAT